MRDGSAPNRSKKMPRAADVNKDETVCTSQTSQPAINQHMNNTSQGGKCMSCGSHDATSNGSIETCCCCGPWRDTVENLNLHVRTRQKKVFLDRERRRRDKSAWLTKDRTVCLACSLPVVGCCCDGCKDCYDHQHHALMSPLLLVLAPLLLGYTSISTGPKFFLILSSECYFE